MIFIQCDSTALQKLLFESIFGKVALRLSILDMIFTKNVRGESSSSSSAELTP
jgi:hypothetical protein